MIDRTHKLSVGRQAEAFGISRGSACYLPRPVSDADLTLMRRIDELHLESPFAGSRMLKGLLNDEGHQAGRCHVATLMKRMGIAAIYRRSNMSKPAPGHDNVFVGRLRRTVEYEEVYLRAYASVSEARASIGRYLGLRNGTRPHSSLGGQTPDRAYLDQPSPIPAAAGRDRRARHRTRDFRVPERGIHAAAPCCRTRS